MKLFNYLFPVCTFILASVGLYIPPGPLENQSRELAQANMPSTSANRPGKEPSWAPHVVEPCVQSHAMLAKRTTDEESPNGQEDVTHGTNTRVGPVTYTSEQLTMYREEFNAANRASTKLRNKVKRARDAGLEVSQDDVDELAWLTTLTTQRRLDVASLLRHPEIQELAKSGVYSAQQLAECRRSYYDAGTKFRSRKLELAKVAKVRKVTKAERQGLADLKRDYNLQRKIWDRVSKGKPADYRVDRPKKSMDDLLESAELHEIAQSSGYSVKELAEAKRGYLDSVNKANAFKRELAEVGNVREVKPEEKAQLQKLLRAVTQQERVFARMCRGEPVDGRGFGRKKDVSSLLKDPEIQRIAQLGGYSVEEVAVQKRGYLDALYEYRAAQKLLSALKEERGTLTPEKEADFLRMDYSYQLQKTAWDRMKKGERLDPAIQPPPKVGLLAQDVAALRQRQIDLSEDGRSARYTDEEIAAYNQAHLVALRKLRAFEKKLAAAGHPPTTEDEVQRQALRKDFNEKKTIWTRAQSNKPVDRKVYSRRAGSSPKSARSQDARPDDREQASQAKQLPSTHQPLQLSGSRRLLAPVLSPAHHFLHGVARQWRAMPWTRYLANPRRLNSIKPAELLRAEHAL
ncbi:MAG: hypothetical protein M1826_003962 [Phylliscum demangeonii]|nr:MAG: hypothetical protein M1826_003962 [Phylliscum demangeonii]